MLEIGIGLRVRMQCWHAGTINKRAIMDSKTEKLREIFLKSAIPESHAPLTSVQEVYERRLSSDMERTGRFLEQAKTAIAKLEQELAASDLDSSNSSGWDPETREKARLLALHEVYRQLPYLAMKNDLIGIATALTLTQTAVSEQRKASDELSKRNLEDVGELQHLKAIRDQYKQIEQGLAERIAKHPQRMAEMQSQLDGFTNFGDRVEEQLKKLRVAAQAASAVEDRFYEHTQLVLLKLYALIDWENASMMDEKTFLASLAQLTSFIETLVRKLRLGRASGDYWHTVARGTPEERLSELMVRGGLLLVRDGEPLQVKLREYGEEM